MSDIEDDQKLTAAFAPLEPAAAAVARMQVRVVAAHDVRPRSLWLEWWSLLRARPLANGALMAVAAVILFFITPLGALPALLERGVKPNPLALKDVRDGALHPAAQSSRRLSAQRELAQGLSAGRGPARFGAQGHRNEERAHGRRDVL